jgi:hypothetical protein
MATPSVAIFNHGAADLGIPPRVTLSTDWYYSGDLRERVIEAVASGRLGAPRRSFSVSAADVELMRLIDEQYLKTPFYGARKILAVLSRSGHQVGASA